MHCRRESDRDVFRHSTLQKESTVKAIRLFLSMAGSLGGGLLLLGGFIWVIVVATGFFRTHSNNVILQLIGTIFVVGVVGLVVREQLILIIKTIKGYSSKQIFFGDTPHRLLRVEENWQQRKMKWRRLFGRE
jgi:hypothetical protein